MNIHSSPLLSKLVAFAARTPSSKEHIDEILQYIMKFLRHQFEAYLIDIMWEDKQAKEVELRALAMLETENNGYNSRRVYLNRESVPDSLMGWCYVYSKPIWIIDEDKLSKDKSYLNQYDESGIEEIPEGTLFEYNRRAMKTEICVPLQSKISEGWKRTAGVLNIESPEMILPTNRARELLYTSARVIEQLHNRMLVLKSAEECSRREMEAIRKIGSSFEREMNRHPNLRLCAFVVRAFGAPVAQDIYKWIKQELRERCIQVVEIQTNDRLVPEMWTSIQSCHFGVVVSTGFNRNVMLEWGYLLGCGKPVIRLHQVQGDKETDPFDVSGTKRFEYADRGENPSEKGVREAGAKGINAMVRSRTDIRELL